MSNDSGGLDPPPPMPTLTPSADHQSSAVPIMHDNDMEVEASPSPPPAVPPSPYSAPLLGEASAGVLVPPLERAAQMVEEEGSSPVTVGAPYGALVTNLANLQQQQQSPPAPRPPQPSEAPISPTPAVSPPSVGLDDEDEEQKLMLSLLGVDPQNAVDPSLVEESKAPISLVGPSETANPPAADHHHEKPDVVDEQQQEEEEKKVEANVVGPVWRPKVPFVEQKVEAAEAKTVPGSDLLRHGGMKVQEDGSVVRNREVSSTGAEFVRCAECGKWRLRPRCEGGPDGSRATCSSFVATSCDDPCDWITSMLDAVELLPLIPLPLEKKEEKEDAKDEGSTKAVEASPMESVKSEALKKTPELGPAKRATTGGKKSTAGGSVKGKAGSKGGSGGSSNRTGKVGRPRKVNSSTTPKTKPALPSPESPSSNGMMMNSWVQCDCCRRWRMISAELAKAKEGRDQIFVCSELPGKSCEDPCDWIMDTQGRVMAGEPPSPPGASTLLPRHSSKGGNRRGSTSTSSSRQSAAALPSSGPEGQQSTSTVTKGYPEQVSISAVNSSSSPEQAASEGSTLVDVVQVSVDAVECLLDWDQPRDRYYVKWKGADVQLGDWEPSARLLEVPEEMKEMARKEGSRWSAAVAVTDARRKRARTTLYTDMRLKRQEELIAAAARQPGEVEGPSTAPTVSPAPPMMPPDISAITAVASSSSVEEASGHPPTAATAASAAAAAAGVTAISHTEAFEHPKVTTARPKAKSRMQARKQAMLAAKHRQQGKKEKEQEKILVPVKEEKGSKNETTASVAAAAGVKVSTTPKKAVVAEVKQEVAAHKGKSTAKGSKRSLKKAKDAKAEEVEGSIVGSEKGGRKRAASTPRANKGANKAGKKRSRGRPPKSLFSDIEEEEGDTPDIDGDDNDQAMVTEPTPKKKRTRTTTTTAEGARTPKATKKKVEEEVVKKSPKVAVRGEVEGVSEASPPPEEAYEKTGKRRRSVLKMMESSDDDDEEEAAAEEAAVKRRKRKKKHEGKKMKHKKNKKVKGTEKLEAVDVDTKVITGGSSTVDLETTTTSVSYPMPTGKVPTLHHRADAFMLCVKPVGCTIETAIAWAKALISAEEGDTKPEDVELIAGVMDEEYSGLCLFGLSAATNAFLKEQARTQTLCLGYLCVIAGRPPAPNGLLHGSLGCSYTTVATMTDSNTGKIEYALIYVNATPHEEGSLPLLPPHIKLASADTHSLLYYGLKGSGRSSLVHASRLAFYPPMPNSPHTPIPIAGFEISIPPEYAEFLRFAGDTQTNWEPLKVSMSCNRFANVGPDHWVVGGSRQGQAASVCFPSGYCPSCFTVYPSFSSRQVCNKCSEGQTLLAVPWARHVTYQQAASNLLTAQQPEHVLHNQHEIAQAAAAASEDAKNNDEGRESDNDPLVQLRRHVITTVRLNFESRGQGFAGGVGVLIADVEAQLDAELPTWRDAVPHSAADSNRVGLRGLLGDTEPERRSQGIMKIYLPFESLPRLAQHPEYSSYMHSQTVYAGGPISQKGSESRWQQQQQYHHHKGGGVKWGQQQQQQPPQQQHYKGSGGWASGHKGDWSKYRGVDWSKKGSGGDRHHHHRGGGGPSPWASSSIPSTSRPLPRNWTSSYDQYLHHHTTDTEAPGKQQQRPSSGSPSGAVEEAASDLRRPSPGRVVPQQQSVDRSTPPQMSSVIARATVAAARESSWSDRPVTAPMSPAMAEGMTTTSPPVQRSTSEISVALASPASAGLPYAPSNPEMSPAAMSESQKQPPLVPRPHTVLRPLVPLGMPQVPEVVLSDADVKAIVELTALIRQRCGNPMLAAPGDGSSSSALQSIHTEGPSPLEPPRDPREVLRRAGSAARSGGGSSTRARSPHSRTPPPRRRNEERERNRMYYRTPDKDDRSSPRGARRRRGRTASDSESRSRSIVARRRRTSKSGSSGEAGVDSGSLGQGGSVWTDPGRGWDHHGGEGGWNTGGGKGRSAWHRKAH